MYSADDARRDGCYATEWTPLRCLQFITAEGAVRNDAYFGKVQRVRDALEAATPTIGYSNMDSSGVTMDVCITAKAKMEADPW